MGSPERDPFLPGLPPHCIAALANSISQMAELIHISVCAVYWDHQTHERERQTASQSKGHSDK